jgi:hypothetical protein
MSVAFFLLMPAVLVVGTLVLICRKFIFRTFASKCKEEQPDSFDPESMCGAKLWDGNVHHQYHDLRQRSNSNSWHSELQIPPFYPQHLQQPYLANPPAAHQSLQSPSFYAQHLVPLTPIDTSAGLRTPALPRPGCTRKGSKPPSPVPGVKPTKLTSSSIDSADVAGRTYLVHKSHKQPPPPVELTTQRSYNSTLPPLIVGSSISTPSISPYSTRPGTPVGTSPVINRTTSPMINHAHAHYDSFYDANDAESGRAGACASVSISTTHTTNTSVTHTSNTTAQTTRHNSNDYIIHTPGALRADVQSILYTPSKSRGLSSADIFFSADTASAEHTGQERLSSRSADYVDTKQVLQPLLPVVQGGTIAPPLPLLFIKLLCLLISLWPSNC